MPEMAKANNTSNIRSSIAGLRVPSVFARNRTLSGAVLKLVVLGNPEWRQAAGISAGRLLRAINKGGRISHD